MNILRRNISKILWYFARKKLKICGSKSFMGENFRLHGEKYISIGDRMNCAKNCELSAWMVGDELTLPELNIGNDVTMAEHSYISCINKIEIGDGCLFGINTFITDNYHGKNTYEELLIPPNERELYSKGSVIIGKNVWTGRNVCIMPGVSIGDGAIIGANAVVTHDIPANCIAVGVPARVIKTIDKKVKILL